MINRIGYFLVLSLLAEMGCIIMGFVVQKYIEHLGYEMKVLRCFAFLIGIFLGCGFQFLCMILFFIFPSSYTSPFFC